MLKKPVSAQRGRPVKWVFDQPGVDGKVVCPFCQREIKAHYHPDFPTVLIPEYPCWHFLGFYDGGRDDTGAHVTSAHFEGSSEDLNDGE